MKGKLIYITGGARSGKSTFAESIMMEQGHKILYIATAIPFDGEMKHRIKKHREIRPSFWNTLEAYKSIGQSLDSRGERFQGILLDCITLMITNLIMEQDCGSHGWTPERLDIIEQSIMSEVDSAVAGLRAWGDVGVIVSNEVGMGLVPDNPLGRVFRDIAGRANRFIAAQADRGYLVVSGIPMELK